MITKTEKEGSDLSEECIAVFSSDEEEVLTYKKLRESMSKSISIDQAY